MFFLGGCSGLAQLLAFCSFIYAFYSDHTANWNHLPVFDSFQPK